MTLLIIIAAFSLVANFILGFVIYGLRVDLNTTEDNWKGANARHEYWVQQLQEDRNFAIRDCRQAREQVTRLQGTLDQISQLCAGNGELHHF